MCSTCAATPIPAAAFRRFLEEESSKPFDLTARGYLFRITLIQFGPGLWYCVLKVSIT